MSFLVKKIYWGGPQLSSEAIRSISGRDLTTEEEKRLEKLGPEDKIMLDFFKKYNRMPDEKEFVLFGGKSKQFEKSLRDVGGFLRETGIDIFGKETKTEEFNPYLKYMEQQRKDLEQSELGFLNTQSDIQKQNAEISAQQAMVQQAQFKDQLVEQIKSDRISKMRSGLSPMQIAQDNLQFMVGNMQANNQQMQMLNQQNLMATQQKKLNPYQAYLTSMQNVTGGQGMGNIMTGMAATDAGDLTMQMNRMRTMNPTWSMDQVLRAVQANYKPQ
jgi:hypothetical protein